MHKYTTLVTGVTVLPEGEPIYSARATTISVDDEAGGAFIKIKQCPDDPEPGEICIDLEEWPHIVKAMDRMIETIKLLEKKV
ncbi:MAG: hypothetical protein WCQ50_21920 [Spirochaetota bacterium]